MMSKWFFRWLIVAAVLNCVIVLTWWFYFVELRPEELWIVLLSTGMGTIAIGVCMISGEGEYLEDGTEAEYWQHYDPVKGTVNPDPELELKKRRYLGIPGESEIPGGPALWAFVVVGVTTVLISVGMYLA